MNAHTHTRFWTPIVAVLGPALFALPVLGGEPIDERVSASKEGRVSIENLSGSVTVTGWDEAEVHVTGTLGDGVERLDVRHSEDRVSIEVVIDDSGRWNRKNFESTDLEVRVPRGSEVEVEGVNLAIGISGVDGPLDLEMVNGTIDVTGNPASVDAETVNGVVVVDGASGSVDVEAVSGTITLRNVKNSVSAESVSGTIEVTGGPFSQGDFASVSGTIRFTGSLSSRASLDFETHSGDVVLALPSGISADFGVETFSGDISSEFGRGRVEEEDFGLGKSMQLTVGSGEASITITTFSGDVEIRKQ